MATTKITDLTAYTDPVNTDVLPIVDVTSDVTKKVSIANVMKNASLGSNTAPGIAFDGDPNTGIYSPGADQVAVTTGGTQRLLIDSAGAVTIAGDLTVNGTTTNINTTNLVIEDKNIILGDVTTPTDVTADGGGITLKGTTDKTINWVDSTDAWTSSERFSYPLGSAAAPTLTFTGDANTGIYSPGADQVAISTNGTGRLFVNADGTIDFGTTSGSATPTVKAASNPVLSFSNGTNSAYVGLVGTENRLINFSTNGTTLIQSNSAINFNVVGSSNFTVSTANTERMRLDSSGRLGVGTSAPQYNLHGTGYVGLGTQASSGSGAGIHFIPSSSATNWFVGSNYVTTGAFQIIPSTTGGGSTFTTPALTIDPTGKLGLGSSSPASKLTVAGTQGNYRVDPDSVTNEIQLLTTTPDNSGFRNYRVRSNQIFLETSGSTALTIDTSQRVGIGTSSPSKKLEIANGDVRLGDGYTLSWGDDSWRIFRNGTQLRFDANGTQALTIDSSQRVGIGTTSPARQLDVNSTAIFDSNGNGSTTSPSIAIGSTGTGLSYIGSQQLAFLTNSAERARIDSSGRLLVGTSTAFDTANTGTNWLVGIENPSNYTAFSIKTNQASSNGAYINLCKSRGTTANSKTLVNNNDELGGVYFEGADGSAMRVGANISAYVDGTPGASDLPTRLVFSTTADGASSPTERMRISNNGSVGIGVTDPAAGASATSGVAFRPGSHDVWFNHANGVGSGTAYAYFSYNSGAIGSITQNGTTAVAYNTTSDYRLKENFVPLTGAADRVNQLEVRRFNFIAEPDRIVDGFIAHEVQAVVPEAITGQKDAVDADGNPVYQGIDQSKLVPLLTAALQEALAEIESLKARVTALEP